MQALLPYLAPLKESLQQLKASKGSSSKAGRKGSSKPTHVELLLDVRQLVFSIEQHWMEMWMAVHGPVLQVGCREHLVMVLYMVAGTMLLCLPAAAWMLFAVGCFAW